MNLVATTGEFCGNIFGQQFCIASGHKYIHIVFTQIAIQNSFKAIQHLNFIKQQIIHSFINDLGTDISHEFFRINPTLFLFNLNQAFPNQIKVICGIKCETDDMVSIYSFFQQVVIKNGIQ